MTPSLRRYYGPELRSGCLAKWAKEHDVQLLFIEPGKPAQNEYIERFNQTYREEVLAMSCLKMFMMFKLSRISGWGIQ